MKTCLAVETSPHWRSMGQAPVVGTRSSIGAWLNSALAPPSCSPAVVEYDVAGHWQSVDYFTDMVGRFRRIGIDEFEMYWPQTRRDRPSEQTVFDEVTHDVMPEMRATG